MRYGRIIDANVNRAVEGLRVIEEIARFVLEDRKATRELKNIRAKLRLLAKKLGVLQYRGAETDVGRDSFSKTEAKRETLLDVFAANMKRIQEALRVLEEFVKLVAPKEGRIFKGLRFQIYTLEQVLFPVLEKQEKLNFGLYVLTDPILGHLKTVRAAIAGGVRIIQLRDKRASQDELLKLAKKIRGMTQKAGVTFIVNDNIKVAKEAGVDGVHVGQDEPSIAKIRKQLGNEKIIGVSVANVSQALRAQKAGVDYVAVGPIFKTPIKAELKPLGLKVLQQVVHAVKIPVVAIGGIDRTNVKKILETGCSRFAVIRAARTLLMSLC